ncbi:hypothetical protein V6N12_016545 [Hibiscus sabdariffa]|uniref:Uncharacterized protein n=1 Tax=Hibiscus sabdariffa TaxID=183260 RepID=A0ABR2CEA8_9ROSI
MEEYPEELRSPAVALVALLTHLLQRSSSSSSSPGGFLKRDWLVKHRTKIPAVVAALLSWDRVSDDPAQWVQVCSDLDDLKAAIRPKNTKLLLLVVVGKSEDISEDRLIALRKRAEVDSKYLLLYNPDPSQLDNSLQRLSASFAQRGSSLLFQKFRGDWAEALRFYEDAYYALREMIATLTRLSPIQRF